jgi:anti-anti-sigma factor
MLKPSVEVREGDGFLVAEFWDCHRLDPAPVADLRRRVDDHLGRGGRAGLVVNLLGVGYAGSAALSGFTGIHRALKARGGSLVFAQVEPNVREIFRVGRLEPLFRFATDVPEALALLAAVANGEAAPAPDAGAPRPSASGPLRRRRPE